MRCESRKVDSPTFISACGGEDTARFIVRMLNPGEPEKFGAELWLCEGCLRAATADEMVIFSSAIPRPPNGVVGSAS